MGMILNVGAGWGGAFWFQRFCVDKCGRFLRVIGNCGDVYSLFSKLFDMSLIG